MKISRRIAIALLPLAAVLAGCQSAKAPSTAAPAAEQTAAATSQTAQPEQAASVNVFAASAKQVKGYQAVKLSEKQTIYVSPEPTFTRLDVASVGAPVKDTDGNVYVRLNLKEAALKKVKAVPNDQGFVTLIGGQVASLRGFSRGNSFYFQTRDAAAAQAITAAVVGQNTK